MKDKLSILIPSNADYSEIKDSVKDVLIAGLITEDALSDGWDWMDLLEVPKIEERISEVIKDAPVFAEQFLQLRGETSVKAVTEAASELVQEGYVFGPVTQWIIKGLYVLATTYQSAEDIYFKAKGQYDMIVSLIEGGEVMPELPAA